MKIYFFTSKLNFKTSGGSIEEFDLMMRALQEYGNEVVAVTLFSKNNDIEQKLPYPVIEESLSKSDVFTVAREVYALLKKYEHDADFFHVDGHLCLYGAGLYRRLGGKVPVSAFFNRELGSFPPDRSFLIGDNSESSFLNVRRSVRWVLERTIGMYLARAIDVRSFISPMYEEMYTRFGLYGGKTSFVLGDPINLAALKEVNGITEHSYRERLNRNKPLRIFFSSRMAPAKGFDLILAGFARVKNKDDFRLVLGGDGPEEGKIKQLAATLGIEQHIDFLGWISRDRLYEEYKKADIFVQVGWRPQGTSISLLYALAFGLPCIVPRNTGLAWQAGTAALTVENGNHDELARAIERLGARSEERASLSDAALARVKSADLDYRKQIARWYGAMRAVARPRRRDQ